jgi:orotate phosphoribosyltransferase-like protein
VVRALQGAGIGIRYRVDADADAARELYESGLSLVRVGAELGVSAGTVLNLLDRAGIRSRPGRNESVESVTDVGVADGR